jgi:type I restriction enzyme S subunit
MSAQPHQVHDARARYVLDASASDATLLVHRGWPRVEVGDVLKLVNGRAFKPVEWSKTGLPIVRIQNLNNPDAPFNYFEGELPPKFLLDDGDLLFAWSGTPDTSFGAHIWHGGKAWLNQHIYKVQFDELQFDKKFLQLAINQNLSEYIRAAHGGAGLAHITKGQFEQSTLPAPPLSEQVQVVAEIEKQFTRLDAGVAALRRVQANLKRHRAAVLKAACEGRLVPTEAELAKAEGRTYETGEQLLARLLADRRKNWEGRGKYKEPTTPDTTGLLPLPEGWMWASAEQLCEFITKGTTPAPGKMLSGQGDIPFIKVYNLTFTGALNLEYKPVFVSTATHEGELKRSEVRAGDVLINIVGPPLGQVSVVPPTVKQANINQAIARFRAVEPECRAHVAVCLMTADIMAWAVRRAKTTAGQTNLTLELCRGLPIPLPPLKEQSRINAEVDRRLSVIEELEAAATASLRRATRLRQSILKKSFSGEANYEPR